MKGKLIILLTLLFTTVVGIISCSDEDTLQISRMEILTQIGNENILMKFKSLEEASNSLHQKAEILKGNPTLCNLIELQSAWKEIAYTWGECDIYIVGPVKSNFYDFHIGYFLSDVDKIEENLSTTETIDSDYIEKLSSSSRGLYAIEYLIFPLPDSNNENLILAFTEIENNKMNFLVALTSNIEIKAKTIFNSWNSGMGNYLDTFISEDEANVTGSLNKLINQIILTVENAKNDKIGRPLGKVFNVSQNHENVQAYRSQYSSSILKANLNAIIELFEENSNNEFGALGKYLNILGKSDLRIEIESKINELLDLINNSSQSLSLQIVTNDNTPELLYNSFQELALLLKVDLASALQVTLTFTDNDGD